MTYIPTVSQLYLINEVSQGDALDPVQVVLASSITIMVGLLALIAAQRLFSTERIILGK
jgi:hypothetical protein